MDEELVDACGSTPSFACEWIFERTENDTLATVASWLVDRPLRIVLIALVAWILNRMFRNIVSRGLAQLLSSRAKDNERVRRARERAGFRAKIDPDSEELELQERSNLRTQTAASVLKSTVTVLIYSFAALLILGELSINLGPLIA